MNANNLVVSASLLSTELAVELGRLPERAGGGVTQQYLAGELSLRLARLQGVAANRAYLPELAYLRREAETGPLAGLSWVLGRALTLGDGLCWDALESGEIASFTDQAAACAELCELGVCAGLLDQGHQS
jgi:hypothetical protein